MKKSLFLILTALLIFSCSKDSPLKDPTVYRLTKITSGDHTPTLYFYDKLGRLDYTSSGSDIYDILYDEQGRYIGWNSNSNFYSDIIYNNNDQIITEYNQNNPFSSDDIDFHYNNIGQMIKFSSLNGQYYFDYEYNEGNVVKISKYKHLNDNLSYDMYLAFEAFIDYDDKNKPITWTYSTKDNLYWNKNNITKVSGVYYDENGSINSQSEHIYQYEYNDKQYPIKNTFGGVVLEYFYENIPID